MSEWLPGGGGPAGVGPPGRIPLIPDPDEPSAGRNLYEIAGTVLGAALGVITVAALVVSLVVAIRHEEPDPVFASNAAARTSPGDGGANGGDALDYPTSGGSDQATAETSGTDTGSSTAASDATASAGGGSGSTSGTEGGGSTPTSGAFNFAPPEGRFAATGSGYRLTQPPGGAGYKVASPSIEVKSVGGGCYDVKVTLDPDNHTTPTLCKTADGGVVQTKNVQYLRQVLVGNVAEVNTTTINCKPPTIVVPANPAGSMAGEAGGACIGTSSLKAVPGTFKNVGTFSVVGTEKVAGVDAIHIQLKRKMSPNDTQNTQNGDMAEDYWFAPNGLVVRASQKSDATTCFVSCQALTIKFHQEFDITLTSTTPG